MNGDDAHVGFNALIAHLYKLTDPA